MINFEKITSYWDEDKRITYVPQSFSSSSSPSTKINLISNEGVQAVMKSRISKENMTLFLSKKMSEDSIEDYRKLFEDDFFDDYLLIADTPRKYLFDLILAVLFEELLSFDQVRNILDEEKDGALLIFEKMIVLEYNLFSYKDTIYNTSLFNNTKPFAKKYVMNYIPTLLHGVPGIKSYKDLTNLENEMKKVFNPLLVSEISPAYPNAALSSLRRTLKDNLFDFDSIARINKEEAWIEKDKISTYSFFLNYNRTGNTSPFNIEHIRKYRALEINPSNIEETMGFYTKGESAEKIFFKDIRGYSYYPFLRGQTTTLDEDMRKAHIFLKKYGEQIIERTINY
jgi:hypothetical protein